MKKAVCILFLVFLVFAVSDIAVTGQKPPKLECKKIALQMARAFEERDMKTLSKLSGQEASDEEIEQFKQQLDAMDEQGMLAPMLERMRNFPDIGDIPDWADHVTIEYRYVDGDRQIEFESEFILIDNYWQLNQFAPEDRGDFESEKEWILENSLPAPPGGQKSIDAGFNEVVSRVLTAIKEGDEGTLFELTPLHISDIQGDKEKYTQLLSQFPTIGPIPAPLIEFDIKLESEDSELTVKFECPENRLKIVELEAF
jgi:hypothetical protein